jgi:ubiquinone/menaquinone biosynthesis C-methylase UbiE
MDTVMDNKTKEIIDYYGKRASKHGDCGHATLLDDNMRVLEIETVQNWLRKEDRVLEIFCGNGVSTLEFAPCCNQIVACDLSDKMITSAKRNLSAHKPPISNVVFEQHNVLDVDKAFENGQFNTVVSIRGLINLPTRELQKEAILKLHRLLPTGGRFIFIEGIRNGLNSINNLRKDFSLKPLSEPWYDNNFEEPELTEFLSPHFSIIDERKLDIYFLISRVLYPHACSPAEAEFSHLCNTVAKLLVPMAETKADTSLLVCLCLEKK